MPEAPPANTVNLHGDVFSGGSPPTVERPNGIGWHPTPWRWSIRFDGAGACKFRYPNHASVIVLLLLIGGVTAAVLRVYYADQLAQAEVRAVAFTHLLEEHTLRNIQTADLILQFIVDASPQNIRAHDPQFEDLMRRRLQSVPYIRSLIVLDADGRFAQATFEPGTLGARPIDREYFTAHTADSTPRLHVSRPTLSRKSITWMVPLSRRLNNPDGSFAGVVVAALEPTFYEHFYARVRMNQGEAIALWHADGPLAARFPEDFGQVGEKASWARAIGEFPRGPAGVFVHQNPDAGEQCLVAYRQLPDVPLIVTTSISLTAAMKQTWKVIYASVGCYGVLCVLALTTSILISRHEREREDARRRSIASQKAETLSRMTGCIAHDFGNVLAAIGAAMRLVSSNLQDPKKIKSCIAAAQQAVERGGDLTSRLLTFAKRQSLDVKMADLNDLLSNLEPLLQHVSSGVKVGLELGSGLPPCRLDQTQFDAAILNIVINARDAMPEGGQVTIATSLQVQQRARSQALKPGQYVLVRITDTGQGIPREIVSRVFEPFFTTKGEHGTGLGLAQVHGFMDQIGGGAHIISAPGAGTTVELYFPASLAQNSTARLRGSQ